MTLTNKAYLVVSDGTDEAIFEMNIGLEHNSQLEKSFIMGGRGQYISEIVNQTELVSEDVSSAKDRRTGYWIDGGAGSWSETIAFETGQDDVTWGDGSGGDGPANVTERDASGADVNAISRYNIFEHWMARSITDSRNPGWLFFGEWTTSDNSLPITTPEGAFNQEMPVAVTQHNLDTSVDEPGNLRGTVTLQHIKPFPDLELPSWLGGKTASELLTSFAEGLGVISDA